MSELRADERDALTRLRVRYLTAAGTQVGVAVAAGAAGVAVTFARSEPDARYGVACTPSWGTTTAVAAADKTTSGVTVHFGTVAPVGGGTLDILTFRTED